MVYEPDSILADLYHLWLSGRCLHAAELSILMPLQANGDSERRMHSLPTIKKKSQHEAVTTLLTYTSKTNNSTLNLMEV